MISRGGDKWRDDIAIAIAEGNDLVSFDLLVSVEPDVVAAFLRRCRRAVAVDDGNVEEVGMMKVQYRLGEDRLETTVGLPPSKGAIDTGIVDL